MDRAALPKRRMAVILAVALCFSAAFVSLAASLPPVETRPANTGYQPAFAGQTRAPGIRTETAYAVKVLTEGLNSPWAVAALPDGRLIVTEKDGWLRIYSPESGLGEKIGGFPAVDSDGQGGLLDVAPAPDFQTSRLLYFTLAQKTGEGSLTAVGWGRLADDERSVEDFRILWRALPYDGIGAHFGSRLAFHPDGSLFVSTGDRQSARNRAKAQALDNGWGKILRLTPEGGPTPGNPFQGQPGALGEIFSYGHRNVQGLAVHPETRELWASEMGPRGGDELNLILPGRNYGWPVISYGIEYSGAPVGEGLTAHEGMEQPVYYWDPVLAPGGMAFYASDTVPEWRNSLFITGLAGQHVSRLVIEGGRVIGEERLLAAEGQRFRDIAEGTDGALYAVTDGGRLYRIGK